MPVEPNALPRILLVEDDATSAAFLTAAVEALPATVEVADSFAAAYALVQRTAYGLWLFDANLPDGTGIDLLQRLRAEGHRVPAIAHTAAHERAVLDTLIEAGFEDVLVKPLAAMQLQHAIRHALGMPARAPVPARACHELPVWDDEVAAAALKGSLANVQALRKLCLGELPRAREAVASAIAHGDRDGLQCALHKLRASCGFVGASRLDRAVHALQEAPDSDAELTWFYQALQDTLSPD